MSCLNASVTPNDLLVFVHKRWIREPELLNAFNELFNLLFRVNPGVARGLL